MPLVLRWGSERLLPALFRWLGILVDDMSSCFKFHVEVADGNTCTKSGVKLHRPSIRYHTRRIFGPCSFGSEIRDAPLVASRRCVIPLKKSP